MGSRLARNYAEANHQVILGSRRPDKAESLAREIGSGAHGGSLVNAAQDGDVIVLAVGFRDAAPMVSSLRDILAGKIIVDITNPFGAVDPGTTSGIEENRKSAQSARWVAAYKTTFWKTLEEPTSRDGHKRDVFVCSDDEEAKQTVIQLIEETGFRAVDCGRLSNARTLDLMVPLMLELDGRYGGDALSSWKFVDPAQD